jgi:hypothetical protein
MRVRQVRAIGDGIETPFCSTGVCTFFTGGCSVGGDFFFASDAGCDVADEGAAAKEGVEIGVEGADALGDHGEERGGVIGGSGAYAHDLGHGVGELCDVQRQEGGVVSLGVGFGRELGLECEGAGDEALVLFSEGVDGAVLIEAKGDGGDGKRR